MNGIKKFAYFFVCLLILSAMLLIFQIEGEHVRRKTFDMLQGGDFTSVTNLSNKDRETLQFIYERNKENKEWEYIDINADGKEEIIYREIDTEWTNRKRIIAIFSFVDRNCELILLDTIDNTEYYFIADSKLVYYDFYSGIYGYELFDVCNINNNGEIERNVRLEAFDFSYVDPDYGGNDWWNKEDILIDSKGMFYKITVNENGNANERIVQEKEYLEVFETEIGSYTFYEGEKGYEDKSSGDFQEGMDDTIIIENEEEETSMPSKQENTESGQIKWQVYIQPDMPEPFIEVLRQYEQFMNADNAEDGQEKIVSVDGKWQYVYVELCGGWSSAVSRGEEDVIRYSLEDLTGDGYPELIMGYYSSLDDMISPEVVYYYSQTEGIKMECLSSYYVMELYEDSVIEYISGGVTYTETFIRFQEETESWQQVACVVVDWDYETDSVRGYYWGDDVGGDLTDNRPMSVEEYQKIIAQYATEPVELEWTPLILSSEPIGEEF